MKIILFSFSEEKNLVDHGNTKALTTPRRILKKIFSYMNYTLLEITKPNYRRKITEKEIDLNLDDFLKEKIKTWQVTWEPIIDHDNPYDMEIRIILKPIWREKLGNR